MKLLESRASAPDRCEHCDDERTSHPRWCDRCESNGWRHRLDERYEDGVTPMGEWRGVEWGREFNPLVWHLGITMDLRGEMALSVSLGPWIFYVSEVLR